MFSFHFSAQAAQSAIALLSPKTYGLQYSKKWLRDYIVKEENLAYRVSADMIQSEDSLIPNQVYVALHRYLGGFAQRVASVSLLKSFKTTIPLLKMSWKLEFTLRTFQFALLRHKYP